MAHGAVHEPRADPEVARQEHAGALAEAQLRLQALEVLGVHAPRVHALRVPVQSGDRQDRHATLSGKLAQALLVVVVGAVVALLVGPLAIHQVRRVLELALEEFPPSGRGAHGALGAPGQPSVVLARPIEVGHAIQDRLESLGIRTMLGAALGAPAGMALGIPAVTTEEHGDVVAVDAAELLEEELALIGQLRRGRRALVGPVLRGPVLPLARVGALFEKRVVANGRGLRKVPG